MKDPNWRKCVLHGDSRDVIKRIPDNSVDFILTDPPYNIGKHSTGNIPLPGRSAMNNDLAAWDWVDFDPAEWADEFIRILKPTGNLFIFTSYNQIGKWYDCLDHKFDTSNYMVWHKTNPAPKIFKAGFLNSCEMVFTCWNKKHTWNFISQSEMHNFIESSICMRPERLSNPKHPAQKPVSILKKMIEIASNEDDIIFDPFMGVGSTGVAALELNRRFIGVELEEDYFKAAKLRIEEILIPISQKGTETMNTDDNNQIVRDDTAMFYRSYYDLNKFFSYDKDQEKTSVYPEPVLSTKKLSDLDPIIKWAGGKEKEVKYIFPNAPEKFDRYFEPFVGGGSVFCAFEANKYYINDKSTELISLYNCIATQNQQFFDWMHSVIASWDNMLMFVDQHRILVDLYLRYRNNELVDNDVKSQISDFLIEYGQELNDILPNNAIWHHETYKKELTTNIVRKILRMKKIESEKGTMPDSDIFDNIETAFMSALYMYYRKLYNDADLLANEPELATSLFVFIRNYAYSGMFRYNDKGEFNVPYGGIGYNHKSLAKKNNYYRSERLRKHFEKTIVKNLDFEDFFKACIPSENDFVFLDPPYDTEFSTYAQNEFLKKDQERLANYLINECKAKWMMIIKNTPYIYSLYANRGLTIMTFDKTYLVSFMNRNDKKAEHLIIMNY